MELPDKLRSTSCERRGSEYARLLTAGDLRVASTVAAAAVYTGTRMTLLCGSAVCGSAGGQGIAGQSRRERVRRVKAHVREPTE